MSFIFKAAVVGAGTMGGQIAQTIAAAGIDVVLKDVKQELVDHGISEARKVTERQVGKLVKKGKLDEARAAAQVDEIVGRIHGTLTYDGFGDVDFVIEAVPKLEIKQAVFAELDAVTPGHAILASNTSGLMISDIAAATVRPDKVIGCHYFFPPRSCRCSRSSRASSPRPTPSRPPTRSRRRRRSSRSSSASAPASSSTASWRPASPRSSAPRRRAACRSRRSTTA